MKREERRKDTDFYAQWSNISRARSPCATMNSVVRWCLLASCDSRFRECRNRAARRERNDETRISQTELSPQPPPTRAESFFSRSARGSRNSQKTAEMDFEELLTTSFFSFSLRAMLLRGVCHLPRIIGFFSARLYNRLQILSDRTNRETRNFFFFLFSDGARSRA